MNIRGMIEGLKQKVRDREDRQTVRVASELKNLKADRVRAEGQKEFIVFVLKKFLAIKKLVLM